MRIEPRAAGANLSVDVDGVNLDITPAHPTHPRVDLIVRDQTHIRSLCGTPTVGATLDNRFGVAVRPDGTEVIGWVLIPPMGTVLARENIWTPELDERMRELEAEVAAR